MKNKEIRCPRNRENKVCNQKLLEYEGNLNDSIVYPYCRKCKKSIKLVNERVEL